MNNGNDRGALGLVALGLVMAGVALLAKGVDWKWWTGCFVASAVVFILWRHK